MARKHKPEHIIGKLREAEIVLAQGGTVAEPRAAARSRTRQPRQTYSSPSGCVIKGNRSRRGEWIYHLPGMPYYDVTRPEEMFCSEREAQAAGYRRAIVRP